MDDSRRAVIYLRVSTAEQAERGLGLGIQLEACRVSVAAAGASVVAVERDEGVSGAEGIDVRHGLARAIDLLVQGDADVLVVYRLDRLARDIILQETILQQVWSAGADVWSCSAAETELCRAGDSDPARTLVRQILGAVAQYEKSMIRMRMRGGRRRAADERLFAGGKVPFGWEPDNSTKLGLREMWEEQSVLQRASRLQLEGYNWIEVADVLNAEGAWRRGGKPWDNGVLRRAVLRDQQIREWRAANLR